MTPPKIIGITGTIASGKSLIGHLIAERGYPVIDTDEVVHDLFASNHEMRAQIGESFGESVIAVDGSINRKALGKIVFADPLARKRLESIVHPATIAETKKRIDTQADKPFIFVLVPLLFEVGVQRHYDQIWTVFADDDVVRARLRSRDGLTDKEIEDRLAAQFPQATKRELSDRAIDNSGTIEDTTKQLDQLVAELLAAH